MELLPSRRSAHRAGLVAGVAVAILCFLFCAFFPAVLFGYLAWQNHVAMKNLSF